MPSAARWSWLWRSLRSSTSPTAWHTYGVIWTPTTITFTVDGQQVGSVIYSSNLPAWPDIAMNLDLQSQNLGPVQPSQTIETLRSLGR